MLLLEQYVVLAVNIISIILITVTLLFNLINFHKTVKIGLLVLALGLLFDAAKQILFGVYPVFSLPIWMFKDLGILFVLIAVLKGRNVCPNK